MSKANRVFGYAWRAFRALRARQGLTIHGVARRSGLAVRTVLASEARNGGLFFSEADALLQTYGVNVVQLGLMARLIDEHLEQAGKRSLEPGLMAGILAEFERLQKAATVSTVPMPTREGLESVARELEATLRRLEDVRRSLSAVQRF
jgi:transcriptional regulator with XRE-family HTH domain